MPSGAGLAGSRISFHNADLQNAVTISRMTFRNFFGVVVHDSGPAVGVPHPLNTDFTPFVDITFVPPGANYYVRTNHIWGNNPLPAEAGGNQAGQSMSVTIKASVQGDKDLFRVVGSPRIRERLVDGTEGAEHTRGTSLCFKLDD